MLSIRSAVDCAAAPPPRAEAREKYIEDLTRLEIAAARVSVFPALVPLETEAVSSSAGKRLIRAAWGANGAAVDSAFGMAASSFADPLREESNQGPTELDLPDASAGRRIALSERPDADKPGIDRGCIPRLAGLRLQGRRVADACLDGLP